MHSTKHISAIPLPDIIPQATDSDNTPIIDLGYLTELKGLTDEKVENLKDKDSLKHAYVRDRICQQAKKLLGKIGHPTAEELNHCFPDCDHTEWVEQQEAAESKRKAEAEQAGKVRQTAGNAVSPPTRQQAQQRLKSPPPAETDEIKLSKAEWEWIEKANHPLGGRLFFGGIVTPEFIELDLKLGISNSPHRRRLLDLLSLHCDLSTGITSAFTVEFLADKLQCERNKIREAIKWLVKREILEYSGKSEYPRHFATPVTFRIPLTETADKTKYHAYRIKKKTGIHYREIWERREEFDYPVKSEGECEAEGEAEGVRPPSSS